jgi:ATP-binding protein involved in chromosome partitioning
MPLSMYPQREKKPIAEIRYIIAIAAGKGGVGKSTVAVNLAYALNRLGQKVGILDADIYGPSLRKMLPEDQLPTQQENCIYPAICKGLRMMSFAYFRKENEAAVVRAPIANGLISQFIHNIAWGSLDFLLIDFPPGTGDIHLTLCQQANLLGAIVVTTPQEVALIDVRKAVHLFEQVKIPILGIVENMSYYLHSSSQEKIYLFGQGGGKRLADEYAAPFLGGVPIDPDLCQRGDQGSTAALYQNEIENGSAKAFMEIASQTLAKAQLLKSQTQEMATGFNIAWKENPK